MSQLVITIIVILFPGIIAAAIFDKITTHSKWDSFKFSLYSFILGVLCYSLLQLAFFAKEIIYSICEAQIQWKWLAIWNHARNPSGEINAGEIVLATFLSLPAALITSFLINHKIFNKIAQALKVSKKFGDENLFSYYLNSKDTDWIYVRDKEEEITYQGRVVSFSENDGYQELVLSDVSVYQTENSFLLYELPSIYICKKVGDFLIESVPETRMRQEHDK